MWFSWGFCLHCVGAEDSYPNEMMQVELSVQLVLTDRQLQMWFCHCRLKDWKNLLAKIAQLAQGLQMHYWQRYMYAFFRLKLQIFLCYG